MLYATPGALLTPEHVAWCERSLPNLTSISIGAGSHFLQESSPHRIGREIAAWLASSREREAPIGHTPVVASPIEAVRVEVAQMLDGLDQRMPIAAIVLFKVNPAREDGFLQLADRLTQRTRRLPGCNVFAFHKATTAAEPVEYLIYEDWETTGLFQAQWHSDHLRDFQAGVGDLVVAQPDLRFYVGWRDYRARPQAGPAT